MKSFKIIAETAFSHQGDFDYLMRSVKAAAEADADIIKFQVLTDLTGFLVTPHQSFDKLQSWLFTIEQWQEVVSSAKGFGLDILILPVTVKSLEDCTQTFGSLIDFFEIHSTCMHDQRLLAMIKRVSVPIILGVGGHTMDRVMETVHSLDRSSSDLILMHGIQSFPTSSCNIELGKLNDYKKFGNFGLGYADHCSFGDTDYFELNAAAMALGCRFFEKHLVLQPGEDRVDAVSAIGSADFRCMRQKLQKVHAAIGKSNAWHLNVAELEYYKRSKSLVFCYDLPKGHIIEEVDFEWKVTELDVGLELSLKQLIGRQLRVSVRKDESPDIKHF
jgi:N,N'-diacetyllegionaminate synthase